MERDDVIAELPVAYQRLLAWLDQGWSDERIAAHLGIDPKGVDPLIRLAQAKLARLTGDTTAEDSSTCIAGPTLARGVRHKRRLRAVDADRPDFEALYGNGPVTARMAARLWYIAASAAGAYFDGGANVWLDSLPPVAQRHIDDDFIVRFGERFEILANRLAGGLQALTDITTCTADEVALHLVIDRAHDLHDDGDLDWEWMDPIPRRPGDDDFSGVRTYLFHDHEVLFLFDTAFDGIEDPNSGIYQTEGFANLHPRDWFTSFSG